MAFNKEKLMGTLNQAKDAAMDKAKNVDLNKIKEAGINRISGVDFNIIKDVDISKLKPDEETQEKLFQTTIDTISKCAQLPIVKVEREEFLRSQFGKSEYIDKILAEGPLSVYTPDAIRKVADEVISGTTAKTAVASFATGFASNPAAMVAAGGVDVIQYFGFAINMAQKIAYLFGEKELFDTGSENLSDVAQVKIISYLGGMLGVSEAASLIAKTSGKAGAVLGKQVAAKALTKTAWYPLVKKIGNSIGIQITKQTVGNVVEKAIPVVGGVLSGGLTYVTFKPMGGRLADIFVDSIKGNIVDGLELNEDSVKKQKKSEKAKDIDAIDVDFKPAE